MNGNCYSRSIVAKKPKYKYKYSNLKDKQTVSDKKLIEQLNAVKVPATYTNVVICPNPKNNLLATAYDGTGRKQYFYSKKHLDEARKDKYCNLIFLGMNLPKIIDDIDNLTRKTSSINEEVLVALALKIMMMCNFRVGSENNRKKYETFGFSTLTPDHVKFHNNLATIKFIGKKKQLNECDIKDKSTINMLKKLVDHNHKSSSSKDVKYLFSWNGKRVQPESLNEFLGKYHQDITTKTWRTWFANIRYIVLMRNEKVDDNLTKRKRASNMIVKKVAEELHHTAAICKKNYLMTELTDMYINQPDKWKKCKRKHPDEFFIDFLKSHYSISKDWIRKRSRSKRRDRQGSRKSLGGAFGGPSFRPELISDFRKKQQKAGGKRSSTKKTGNNGNKEIEEPSTTSSYEYESSSEESSSESS